MNIGIQVNEVGLGGVEIIGLEQVHLQQRQPRPQQPRVQVHQPVQQQLVQVLVLRPQRRPVRPQLVKYGRHTL